VEERRATPRQEAYVPAVLETAQGRSTTALTRDISATGLLILTRLDLVVGELVRLTVALDGVEHTLACKVVRLEQLESHELWRHKVALVVDGADPVLVQLQATLQRAPSR
jgi:hypothetical protein